MLQVEPTARHLVPLPEARGLLGPFHRPLPTFDFVCLGARDKDWNPKPSEDRIVITSQLVAVVDGATSVDPTLTYHGLNAAQFAAEHLRRFCLKNAGRYASAADVLVEANTAFGRILRRADPEPDFAAGPSASAALVMFHPNGQFDVAACCDCIVCARRADGRWEQLTCDLLPQARVTLKNAVNPDEPGIGDLARATRLRSLSDPRFRRAFLYNQHIAVMNGDPKFGTEPGLLQYRPKLPLDQYSMIVIMSDGAFYPNFVVGESPALATCFRLEKLNFSPRRVAWEIFTLKEQARSLDLGGKAFDDLTLLAITIPEQI